MFQPDIIPECLVLRKGVPNIQGPVLVNQDVNSNCFYNMFIFNSIWNTSSLCFSLDPCSVAILIPQGTCVIIPLIMCLITSYGLRFAAASSSSHSLWHQFRRRNVTLMNANDKESRCQWKVIFFYKLHPRKTNMTMENPTMNEDSKKCSTGPFEQTPQTPSFLLKKTPHQPATPFT